jgi:Ino eighty subunit 2
MASCTFILVLALLILLKLKPQVSKTRGAAPKPETLAAAAAAADGIGSPYEEEDFYPRAHPVYTRWVSTRNGVKLGVPEEWLGKNVGRCFGPPLPHSSGALVQEID